MAEAVKVAVRVRPFNKREIERNAKLIINIEMFLYSCSELEDYYIKNLQGNRKIQKKVQKRLMDGNQTTIADPENLSAEPKKFSFDYSYWSHDGYKEEADGYLSPSDQKYADQKKVFKDIGLSVLENSWAGYNCSLFAYGQTGSGKSYSVVGYGNNKGIIPCYCDTLFKQIAEKENSPDYRVFIKKI